MKLFHRTKPDDPQPQEHHFRCPACQSDRPNFRMMEMTSHSLVDGILTERVTGYRVACQDCPAIYAIHAGGTFFPHEQSLPLTRPQRPAFPQSNGVAPDQLDAPQTSMPLKPRERPRV